MNAIIEIEETLTRVAVAISDCAEFTSNGKPHAADRKSYQPAKQAAARKKAALTCEILGLNKKLLPLLDQSHVVVDVDADCTDEELSHALHLLNRLVEVLVMRFALDEVPINGT